MKTAPESRDPVTQLPSSATPPSTGLPINPEPAGPSCPSPGRARIPLWLKIAYTLFMAVLVPVYWTNYGPTNFLYFCDVALFLTLVGIWTENRLLLSLSAVGILVPQALWVVDFAAHLMGYKLTGMTDYMFDSQRSLFLRGLSLFHGWLPFLLVFLVARVGYDRRAWLGWTAIGWGLCLVCYFWMPPAGAVLADPKLPVNINYVHGFNDAQPQSWLPAPAYLAAWMAVLAAVVYTPTHWVLDRGFGARRSLVPVLPKTIDAQPCPHGPARGTRFAKILLRSLSALLALLAGWAGQAGQLPPPETRGDADTFELRDVGFRTPASAVWDATADVYLVSNIHGHPVDQDDNGFISRVRPDGTVEALKWIDGAESGVTLHAPKGLAIVSDTLWVADIEVLRRFDRATGRPTGELAVAGASFLNTIASAGDGRLLVTDTGWRRDGGIPLTPGSRPGLGIVDTETSRADFQSMTTLAGGFSRLRVGASSRPLDKPATVEWERRFNGDDPYGQPTAAASFGAGYAFVSWDTGCLYVLTPHHRGGITEAFELPTGQLAGLLDLTSERQRHGQRPTEPRRGRTWLVTSWEGDCVYAVRTGCEVSITRVASDLRAPANPGYDASRNRVLIPLHLDDALAGTDRASRVTGPRIGRLLTQQPGFGEGDRVGERQFVRPELVVPGGGVRGEDV